MAAAAPKPDENTEAARRVGKGMVERINFLREHDHQALLNRAGNTRNHPAPPAAVTVYEAQAVERAQAKRERKRARR